MSEEDDILHDKTFEKNSDKSARIQRDINNTKTSTYSTYDNGEKTGEEAIKGIHFIRQSQTPNIYKHTLDAFNQGKSPILHFDADRSRWQPRRNAATNPYPSRYGEGLERDEYAYASTYEGGKGASIGYVPKAENSRQGLLELTPLYKTLNDKDAFINILVPKERDPEPEFAPVTSDETTKRPSPALVGGGFGALVISILEGIAGLAL